MTDPMKFTIKNALVIGKQIQIGKDRKGDIVTFFERKTAFF